MASIIRFFRFYRFYRKEIQYPIVQAYCLAMNRVREKTKFPV
jgi:hypothetical protein